MQIHVRVISGPAQAQLAALDKQVSRTRKNATAAWGLPWLSKWGNQVQWAGRQLIYNFTLPLALAGGAAAKWALENEKAMTRVEKVYGDGSALFQRLAAKEIPALAEAFEALSNRFGVHQQEVIGIGASWAAAGASGVSLAKITKLTLETMVLGEIEATEATKNLIAIQAQYGFSVNRLSNAIDILNMVENQTGASMRDLMEGMARAAGVARTAGVDVEHLAAMLAALTPAAGSAANAGNGLKTIISRILSPTKEAVGLLREMGVNVDAAGWNSLTATQRIEALADEFDSLSDAQKNHMATVLGSRWQLNRLVILMRAVRDETSYYHRSLNALSDEEAVYAQRQRELNKVLESNPQRVKQAWVVLQNAATDVMQPMLPLIAYIASEIARLGHAFANLGGETQKMILGFLLFIALIGPITRYVGSLTTLFAILTRGVHVLGGGLLAVALGPFKMMGGALVGLGRYVALTAAIWGLQFALMAAKVVTLSVTVIPAIRTFMAAVALEFKLGWVVVQASFVAFAAAMRSLWIAFSIGFIRFQAATAMAIQAVWAFFSTSMLAMFATLLRNIGALLLAGIALLKNPWVLLGLAVLGVLYAMRDRITEAWNSTIEFITNSEWAQVVVQGWHNVVQSIVDAFWQLPTGVRDALLTVLSVVQTIALQIYEWMSYLNPFARHSPSLVENVKAGMDVITGQFARLASVGGIFASALRHLAAYNRAIGGVKEFGSERKQVVKGGGNVGLFDAMIGDLAKLYPLMRRQEAAVAAQEDRVDRLSDRLDKARNRLDQLTSAYDRHQNAMQNFATAPIKGMGAMSDKIFENEQAQKRLRLEMLRWEKANGSVDDMRDRLALLQGDIEELTGHANNLRMQGAGSDILGPIADQIDAIESQSNALRNTVKNSPIAAMQAELDRLAEQGEILDLTQSLKFDPMIREIDKLANAQKELTYEQIVKGIRRNKKAMDELQPAIAAATREHNQLEKIYDREREQLDQMSEAYGRTRDVVSDLEQALRGMGSAAQAANDKAAKGKKPKKPAAIDNALATFRAGAGGNWPDPGTFEGMGRKNMEDQSKAIEEFTRQELAKMSNIFGGFDMFGPLKRWWSRTWEWIKSNVGPVVGAVAGAIGTALASTGDALGGRETFSKIVSGGEWVVEQLLNIFNLFRPDLERIWESIVKAGQKAWDELGPALGELWDALSELWKTIWPLLKPVLKWMGIFFGGVLLLAIKLVAGIISRVLLPVLETIIDVAKGVIRIIEGVVEVITGLVKMFLKGDWKGIIDIFNGLKDIVMGTFEAIWGIIKGVGKVIGGVVKGIVVGIWEFFVWLYDVLVGNSIVPDLIEGIWNAFKGLIRLARWVWNQVLKPIYNWFVSLWKDHVAPALKRWWGGIKDIWNALKAAGRWVWDNVLKPVFDWYKELWERVRKGLARWWDGIKNVWNALKAAGRWVWDNILNPVFDRFKDLWERVRTALARWWDGIKNVWNSLTNLGSWIKNNVMDPVFDRIKDGWERVRDWLSNNKDMLLAPVKGVVNVVIRAVNKLISGLNKVSDVLPGIDFQISTIPTLAKGGIPQRRVGNGFITRGARAIVGEGKANWPEVVIPTDPTYRNRARSLLSLAATKIGLPGGGYAAGDTRQDMERTTGIPLFAAGGWLGNISDKLLNALPDRLPTGKAASFLFGPFKAAANALIDQSSWSVPRALGRHGVNKVDEWLKSLDIQLGEQVKNATGGVGGPAVQRALRWARTQQGKPYSWGGAGPEGYDCSGFMAALMNVIDGSSPYSRRGGTGSMPWPGMAGGATGKKGFNLGWFVGSPGHTAGTLGGVNVEAAGGVGVRVGGPVGYNNSMFNHVAHYTKAANGAIVRATRNGSLLLAGEGSRDEAVTPLPRSWRNGANPLMSSSSGSTVVINGDLSFPNITSGDDAERFIENIKALARD